MLKRLKGAVGKSADELAKMAREKSGSGSRKKRKPTPKRFDAMTEGRKVSQAKKELEQKKKREERFSKIGKSMVALLQSEDVKTPTPKLAKMGGGKIYGDKKKKGMMGGGKMYTSMNKRYANGGKIYPSKGKS